MRRCTSWWRSGAKGNSAVDAGDDGAADAEGNCAGDDGDDVAHVRGGGAAESDDASAMAEPLVRMQTLCKRYANAMVGDGVEAEAEAHGAAEVNANSAG